MRPRSVVFDCDSTLAGIEGITWLASAHREEVAKLTDAAMSGAIPLEQVYARRLAIVRPDRAHLDALTQAYIDAMTPDARDVVQALHALGVRVHVVSGGLRPAVEGFAASLGIPPDRVQAVGVRFEADGAYAGFDTESPLARSHGKRDVIAAWGAALPRPIWLVGDGTTDLEAKPAVDSFIAYTGAVSHPSVAERADAVIATRSLAPLIALMLRDEIPSDASICAVLERGRAMLDAAPIET